MKKTLIRQLTSVALITLLTTQPVMATDWDITNTGQPYTEAAFTLSEGTWMSLSISPDGQTLMFDLLGDIYALPAGGGEARLIHGGPAMQRSPRFSADGRTLLYLSDASGSDNVWISAVDGSDARQLTYETVDVLTGPAWGPDGTIAAAKVDATVARLHNSEIRLFDMAGGSGRVLIETPDTGENVHEASFSPDGRYVYYTEKVTPPSASRVYIDSNHMNYAVKRRDLHTGETEELAKGFGGATTPALSRDGRQLAFVRRVMAKTVLFVYDLKTGEQRPVYDGLDRDDQADFIGQGLYYPHYDWFPDNRHIAIWAGGKLKRVDTLTGTVSDIPFTAHVQHKLTTPARVSNDLAPETVQARVLRQLTVSPDGRSVVFQALGSLWRQGPTGKPERLAAGESPQFEPAFSPDGRQVAFVEWNDERGAALKIASGNTVRTVFDSSGVIREPAFSPDGKHLVYKIDEGDHCLGGHSIQQGIYIIPATGGQPRFVTEAAERPVFSADGQRLFFLRDTYEGDDRIIRLHSVDLNGHDLRTHAKTPNADTSELRLSPDGKWLAFRDRQQYYVLPFSTLGVPVTVSAASSGTRRLSRDGGYGLVWAADSQSLTWALGPDIERASVTGEALATQRIDLQMPADRPEGALAFTGARIITMRGDEIIENGTLVVENNRISAVGPAATVSVPVHAKQIDVTGKTIMPGLVDMHGHVDVCYYSSAGLTAQKQPARYANLAYGVTTNYDPYSSELPTYALSEMTKAGLMVGPRAIDSGMVAYGRTGKSDTVYLPVNDIEDARSFLRRKSALGGLTVKSYRQPMRAQRQMLVKAGREAGVLIDVEGESHLYNNITMIQDGHFNVQHNLPIATYYDDLVQLWARSGVSHTPVLMAMFGEMMGENYFYQTTETWKDPKAQTFIQVTTSGYSPLATPYGAPPYVRNMTTAHVADELWDIGFRSVARSMKRLDEAGVNVTAGSHGQIAGFGMHGEMWLLSEGGMSPHRVLRTATLNGAKALGVDQQIGSLEAGKLADFIVLDNDPLADIRNTNSVRFTIINGRLYDAYTMNEIGNYDRPRGKFFWETGHDYHGIDWKKAWAHD